MLRVSSAFVLTALLGFSTISCFDEGTAVSESELMNAREVVVSFYLPAADTAAIDSAVVVVTAPDIDTIIGSLELIGASLTGGVTGIPSGNDRRFEITVFDSAGTILYTGACYADIPANKNVPVEIWLSRATGSAEITGHLGMQPSARASDILALFHFDEACGDSIYDATGRWSGRLYSSSLVPTPYGSGVQVSGGSYAKFDSIIPNGQLEGTIEFHFKPGASFRTNETYALFGNDGSRVLFVYKAGTLYFLKNHNNIFRIAQGPVNLVQGVWYCLSGSWGKQGMRIHLDRKLIGSNSDLTAYQASPRTSLENQMYVGRKASGCCMEAINVSSALGLEGTVDELCIYSTDIY